MKRTKHALGGLSMPLNTMAVIMQFIGLLCLLGTQLTFLSNWSGLFWTMGIVLVGISIPILVLFKGGTLLAYYGRFAAGFIVLLIAILQACSVSDFAAFIERYASDAAVASHIKNWVGLESFGFAVFSENAKAIALIVIVLEFVCAVGILIGGFVRFNAIVLTVITGWYALCFLHSSFNSAETFVDENTYALNSKEGEETLLRLASKDQTILHSDKTPESITIQEKVKVDEVRTQVNWRFIPKNAFTNNLNLGVSTFFSLVLFCLCLVCSIFGKHIYANTVKTNWMLIPVLTGITALVSVFIHWYVPLFFVPIVLLSCLVVFRSGGRLFANHVGTTLVAVTYIILFLNFSTTLGLNISKNQEKAPHKSTVRKN